MSIASKSPGRGKLLFAEDDKGGVIHVANIKGGVGKSTVATNLAATMATSGSTLVIDLDVQGSASHAFGVNPAGMKNNSWKILSTRYSPDISDENDESTRKRDFVTGAYKTVESHLFMQVVGKNNLKDIATRITDKLDLIPANSDLFNNVTFLHLQNLIHNIQVCRIHYKYIIIDTPSVWNPLTKKLFIYSDLNLIPVTLNALSTRSLKDYLKNVKHLAKKHSSVRIRIIKNEVFGKKGSKVMGKTRTMNENRSFLESLCEQVPIVSESGVSLLPQSVIFDIEIPESATVRSAQDEGKPVTDFKQYSAVTKTFKQLGKRIQFVLNNPISHNISRKIEIRNRFFDYIYKVAIFLVIISIFCSNPKISTLFAPRPVAPQQILKNEEVIEYTFKGDESFLRIVKYAISVFAAKVPSFKEIDQYAIEILEIHNNTRLPDEKKLYYNDRIKKGTKLKIYPPSMIDCSDKQHLKPVYEYFYKVINDNYPYVTGDWWERGGATRTPHYGLDIACDLGADIISPISGRVVLKNSLNGGRMFAVIKNDIVLFFAHMDKRFFNTGDYVNKGDVVGTVGMTGRTSGPHVHVGYGVYSPSKGGTNFGGRRYKITDPKLFFYQEKFLADYDEDE